VRPGYKDQLAIKTTYSQSWRWSN